MPPRALFRQSDFLYDEIWTAEVDNTFIELLRDESTKGNYRVGGDNTLTIQVIQWIINNQFNKGFTYEECLLRVKKLQKRFRVFDWVVHMTGVGYDMQTNTITGEPFVWQHICKEQPFAYAYMTHGDPNWADLQRIFGGAALDDPFPNNVIYISSDEDQAPLVDNNQALVVGNNQALVVGNNQAPVVDNQVIDLSSDGDSSLDSEFWKDMMEGYAYGTPDMYENDCSSIEIHFGSPPIDQASPGSSNEGGSFIAPSSSASNSPSYYG